MGSLIRNKSSFVTCALLALAHSGRAQELIRQAERSPDQTQAATLRREALESAYWARRCTNAALLAAGGELC